MWRPPKSISPNSALRVFLGVSIPPSVGPFSYFDARAAVTQTLFDWKSINATRAASQSLKSAELYLQGRPRSGGAGRGLHLFAGHRRRGPHRNGRSAGQTLRRRSTIRPSDQVNAGTSPDIDGLRTKVELQTRQQQLIQAKNNFAIQKLTVARVIGLAPGQEFELTDKSPYQPIEGITVDEALKRAYASRSDYQAAMTDVRAAEFSRKAAVAGYFPSLSFNADYGQQDRIPPRQRKYPTCAERYRFRSFRATAFTAMSCRPTRDSSRAANAWRTCARRSTPTCAPRC